MIADTGHTAWILTSSALVLLMTMPGLLMFYAGLVRFRNVVSVVLHCFCIAALMSVLWFAVGYSLAFSTSIGGFIGSFEHSFLYGITAESLIDTLPEYAFVMFQTTFAIITPALVVGAYVERVKFSAVMLFSALWLLIVYVPVTHWIWGGGWLADMGTMDFAGGIVVHATAGIAAIIFALVLGKRKGFPRPYSASSTAMVAIGASLLWVGWFGFNGGSALAANGSAALAIIVTHASACTGALVWVALEYKRFGNSSLVAAATGLIAGLATITPMAGFVGLPGGLLAGVVGGVICYYAVQLIRGYFKLDDSLDVFAVHGVGGIVGSIMLPFFATSSMLGGLGTNLDSAMQQLGVQVLATAAVCLWTAIFSYGILLVVKALVGLRVSPEEESEGLDVSYHNESAASL